VIKKASRVDALKLHDLLLGLGILLPDTAVSTVLAQCGKSGGTLDPPLFFAALEEAANEDPERTRHPRKVRAGGSC